MGVLRRTNWFRSSSFSNLEFKTITNEEIFHFDNIRQGNDFGYATDPMAFVRLHYDKKKRIIYFIDEIFGVKMSIRELASKIKSKGYDDFNVICDSAEPRSIAELREYGIKALKAKKDLVQLNLERTGWMIYKQ